MPAEEEVKVEEQTTEVEETAEVTGTEDAVDESADVDREEATISLADILKREDVKELLAKIRKEEKDKLYESMSKKDAKIAELTERASALEKTVEAYREGHDTTVADLTLKVDSLTKKVEEAERASAESKLALYRTKRIQEVRDSGKDLIEDLVTGNTEEAIDSSIEVAMAKYEEIVARAAAKREPKAVPKPTAPKQDAGARKLTLEEIQRMSPAEYAKHREEIKRSMR